MVVCELLWACVSHCGRLLAALGVCESLCSVWKSWMGCGSHL